MTGGEGTEARLRCLVARLDGDVVFAMSQGSKELFHSNLLGWYLRRFPDLRTALLDAWQVPAWPGDPGHQARVRREWRNLDLTVHEPGRGVLVIENKVFALPDTAQLDRYARLAPGGAALALLSMTDPGWQEYHGWRYRSYEDLLGVLRPLTAGVLAADRYAGQSLARWLDMIESLRDLIATAGLPGPDEPLMPTTTVREMLETARLNVPVQKMRFQHLARALAADLVPEISAGTLTVKADVTRATGLAEAFTTGYPRIGWQLQGDAFRLCVEPSPELARDALGWDQIEGQARRHAGFFDFSPVRRLIPGTGPDIPASKNGPLEFRHFRPSFTYRYVRVPDITFGQARQLGVMYARRALTESASASPKAS